MATERDNLEIHVDLCELRYNQLNDRMTRVEHQVKELNQDMQDFKEEVRVSFGEIKDLINSRMSTNYQQLIAASATVIVALIGFLGYLVTHIK